MELIRNFFDDVKLTQISDLKRKVILMQACKAAKIRDQSLVLSLYCLLFDKFPLVDIRPKVAKSINFDVAYELLPLNLKVALKIRCPSDSDLKNKKQIKYESWRVSFYSTYLNFLEKEVDIGKSITWSDVQRICNEDVPQIQIEEKSENMLLENEHPSDVGIEEDEDFSAEEEREDQHTDQGDIDVQTERAEEERGYQQTDQEHVDVQTERAEEERKDQHTDQEHVQEHTERDDEITDVEVHSDSQEEEIQVIPVKKQRSRTNHTSSGSRRKRKPQASETQREKDTVHATREKTAVFEAGKVKLKNQGAHATRGKTVVDEPRKVQDKTTRSENAVKGSEEDKEERELKKLINHATEFSRFAARTADLEMIKFAEMVKTYKIMKHNKYY